MKQAHARPYDRVCHICAKVFISDTMLTEHLKTHKDPNALRVACEFCGKYFAKTLYLRAHVRSMHEEDGVTHKCPECHKKFTKSLNNHIRYHHNFKSHKCNICAKVCKSRHDLKVSHTTYGMAWIEVYTLKGELLKLIFDKFCFRFRNTPRYTPENIFTHAITAHKSSRPMRTGINTANECIHSEWKLIGKRD